MKNTRNSGVFLSFESSAVVIDPDNLDRCMAMYALSPEQKSGVMRSIDRTYHQKYAEVLSQLIEPLHLNSDIHKPSSSKRPLSQTYVDADTEFSKKTFHLKRQFLGKPSAPSPNEIRQNLFDDFRLNSQSLGGKEPFILVARPLNQEDLSLSTAFRESTSLYAAYQQQGNGSYYFRDVLTLNHEWQTLPSLFFDEHLDAYHLEPDVEVEIYRSKSLGMHFIRLPQHVPPQELTLELLLSHAHESTLTVNELPDEVRQLVRNCRDFKDTALTNIGTDATAKMYLDALIQQRKGACRHRAIVFKYMMERDNPNIPVRIVCNDCHMYAEIYYPKFPR